MKKVILTKQKSILFFLILIILFFTASCSIGKNKDNSLENNTSVLFDNPKSSQATICGKYEALSVNNGEYIVQNNVWGADTAQCIEVNGTSFTVTRSDHNHYDVASYPSIYKGIHWGRSTVNSGMPVKVKNVNDANFSVSVSSYRPSGRYNVAAEAWLSPSIDTSNGYNGGAEIMVVLDYHGMYPSGSKVGTFNGHDVYYDSVGWNFVTYVKTGRNSVSDDIMDYINDAADRGYVDRSWYLHNFHAGFEIVSGGQGLILNDFSFNVIPGNSSSSSSSSSNSSSSSSISSSSSSYSSSGNLTADYNIINDWGTGFVAEVTITNNTNLSISNWTAQWKFEGNQDIHNSWNAKIEELNSNVSAMNLNYNGNISPGQSVSFGFQASYSGTNGIPDVYVK